MGKLIICSTKRAKEPYYFHDSDVVVYSIEELCYYISNYLFFVNEQTIDTPLFEWIDRELGLKKRAERLMDLSEAKADLKTLITVILCSCDYYTEDEIKAILNKFDGLMSLPPIKREILRAKNYMLEQNYNRAEEIFDDLLHKEHIPAMTAAEYGELLHNLTVSRIQLYGLSDSYEGFLESYLKSGNEESMKQYIIALLLLGKEEKLQEEAMRYGLVNDIIEEQMNLVFKVKKEARDNFEAGFKLRNYKSEGRMSEFYQCADMLIQKWMQEYRKGK